MQIANVEHIKEEKKIPNLRFPGFEGEWDEKKIGTIFTVKAGGDIDSEHVSKKKTETFKYPIYANAEKKKGLYGYSDKYKVCRPSVTVAGRGVNVGIAHARDHKFYPIVRLLVLTPKQEKSIFFYEYAINQFKIFIESTGVPQLTGPQISSYRITYPPLPEQQKIASFLSAVDKKIQQLTRKKELLEQYKKGVMQKIFSREIRFKPDSTDFDSAQPAGASLEADQSRVVERSRNYPDWEEKRLGDILTFISTNSLSRNDLNYDSGEIKNIHYGDIHTTFKMGFDVEKERVPFINEEIDLCKITGDQLCQVGDMVIADASEDYSDIGKAIEVLNINNEKIAAGLHTFLARDTTGQTIKGFKGYLFQTWQVRKQIMKVAQGISVLGISKKNLAKVEFLLPCREEQGKIITLLKNIDKRIANTLIQITQTQKFKKGLQQQMFV